MQAAGTSKDCILERLLKSRTDRAVSETFGDNDVHLKDAIASIYVGMFPPFVCGAVQLTQIQPE